MKWVAIGLAFNAVLFTGLYSGGLDYLVKKDLSDSVIACLDEKNVDFINVPVTEFGSTIDSCSGNKPSVNTQNKS